jgi:ATP-dependent Clp protease ATP-binding subunit ClpC
MTSEKLIPVFAVVESLGAELYRAKLLPPMSLEVVANHWPQAVKLLERGLKKHIRACAPARWANARPMQMPDSHRITLSLKPSKNDFLWTEPFDALVDLFSWSIDRSARQWYCPALEGIFITTDESVDNSFLESQVRSMLQRTLETLHFQAIVSLFCNRQFHVKEVVKLSPSQIEDHYGPSKPRAKKTSLKTLRRVATRVATWHHAPVFELDASVTKLKDWLEAPRPQSVLLVGKSGVGKTALVYQLARSMEDRIWATSGARLVSGMCGFGMWQQRCHQVIREANDARLILHLGSIVELIESGKINGQSGVASMMRGAIDRGQLLAIAECTPEQLSIAEREDPMLLRCFTKMEIEPTDEATTLAILSMVAKAMEDKAVVSHEAIQEVYRLHERYSSYSSMPGQPIRFLRAMCEESVKDRSVAFSAMDVSQRFSQETGLPLFLLDDSARLDIESIRLALASQVIGQPEPIHHIVQLITMVKARLNRTDRPLASLLMIGPTGVGKTETAKALSRLLYRDHDRMIRIDMSEYANPWSAARLIGAGNSGDGTLTSPIRDQPFSVVLLDEFEKCHPSVLDLLLQVLGEGRLTDSLGRIADFRNAVVILTSNLGVDSFHARSFGFAEDSTQAYEHFLREVKRHVRPELLGRIDQIIPYAALSMEVVRKIADRELVEISNRPGVRYGSIAIEVDSQARSHLAALGFDPRYGARPLRREIERQIVMPLAEHISSLSTASPTRVVFHGLPVASDGERRILGHISQINPEPLLEDGETEEREFVDQIRELNLRARLLVDSSPFLAMENNAERLSRQIDQIRKNVRKVQSHLRIRRWEHQIENLRLQLGNLQKKIYSVRELVARINDLHLLTRIEWYEKTFSIDDGQRQQLFALEKELRQELIELHGQLDSKRDMQSIILLADPITVTAPLWQAYRRLAELHRWRAILYRIAKYNPLLDSSSVEFHQRQAATKQQITIPESMQPAFRLTVSTNESDAPNFEQKRKVADVYRINAWRELDGLDRGTVGIAIQLDQGMISSWLGEEHGVHHIVDSSSEGAKRSRVRVIVKPGRFFDWEPPKGWDETPSLQSRDPRRTYFVTERRLISHLLKHEARVSESEPVSDWIEMIQWEANRHLWRSIGFTDIPLSATSSSHLYSYDDMPF